MQRATVTSGDIEVMHQLSGCGSQLGSDGHDREFSAPNLAVLAGSPLVCLSSRAGQLIGSGHGYCFGKRFAIRLFVKLGFLTVHRMYLVIYCRCLLVHSDIRW